MPIDYKEYPENWFTELRPAVLERDENRCAFCGVEQYAVGRRGKGGAWVPVGGDVDLDLAGVGLVFDMGEVRRMSYTEAKEWATLLQKGSGGKYTVVVLTIAHLDRDKRNNDLKNLAALCQRCHLRHDIQQHIANRRYGRNWKRKQLKLDFDLK